MEAKASTPFRHAYKNADLGSHAKSALKADMTRMVEEQNVARKAALDKLSLVSSNGSPFAGHVCKNDNSLSGLLKHYFRERLPEWIFNPRQRERNLISQCQGNIPEQFELLDFILGSKDSAFAKAVLQEDAQKVRYRGNSIQDAMVRLENIGHEGVDFVEGLNVELLEFQRQTLKWALERETTAGGIQSFWWAKVPTDSTRKKDLYYSPILQRFRTDPPRIVRGGFIAEEMGLGKTVISLALILKNPASANPVSGSPIASLHAGSPPNLQNGWDKSLYKFTSTLNSKRGSIISRGTLVIVSQRARNSLFLVYIYGLRFCHLLLYFL
jgi:SNF2 family DNA or RNA helicase